MSKRKKLQDSDWRYNILHFCVDIATKASFRRIKYYGLERIPKDGAVIFAPNHSGALMDAMVMVAMDRAPKVFVARADIFRNSKLAKMFHLFKMMPIMRMRDGVEEVKKNNRTIEIAADVLKDKVPLCIFPEGTHQTKYSMLPLSKGIFRIALQAKELLGKTPLYIVPVGIRYGSFFRFRSTASIQIGIPINIGEFIAQNNDKTPQEQMNLMRKCLDGRMKENILYIPNDENYDAVNEICAAMSGKQQESHKPNGTDPLVAANRKTAEHIRIIKEKKPELAERLIALGNEASQMRKKKGISLKTVAKRPTRLSLLLKSLLLIATLPYTLAAMALTLPLTAASKFLTGKFKDIAFHNSVRYVLLLVLWPLLMIIYTAAAFACLSPHWALFAVLATIPAPAAAHDTCRTLRIIASGCRLLRCKPLMAKYDEIRNCF